MSSILQTHVEIRQRDYRLTLVTPPASEPMSLGDAKQLLGVTLPADDNVITGLISEGREEIEKLTGWRLLQQTWDFKIEQFPTGDRILLPIQPASSIVYLQFVDSTGTTGTVDPLAYTLYTDTGGSPAIVLKINRVWPTTLLNPGFNVTARVIVGAADVTGVPAWATHALRLYVQRHWDLVLIARNREPGTSPRTFAHQQVFDSLIREHRFD